MTNRTPTRRCDRCGDLKPFSDFGWRGRKGARLDNCCRECRARYKHEHYVKNKEIYVERALRRKRQIRAERAQYLIALFRTLPCADCGERDPLVLEFDHRTDKTFNIGEGLSERSWQALEDEIAKCDVVCANCHRRRTAKRIGYARLAIAR